MTDDTTVPAPADVASDEDALDTPAGVAAPGFFIAVGADEFLDLESRVIDLEARIPATLADDEDDEDVLGGRLDRHRAEIEELKRRYNQLVKYLEQTLAAPTVSATVAPVVPAPVVVPASAGPVGAPMNLWSL